MKKKTGLLVVLLFVVIGITIGVTYAIWQITLEQSSLNVISTGCFQIEFQDSNPITIQKAYPISEEEGKKLVPYHFTIENSCGNAASYQINLEIINNTTIENLEYIRTMLNENNTLLKENEEVEKTLENAITSYKLSFGYLEKAEKKDFTLRLWLDENTPLTEEYMNQFFESKITVITTALEKIDKVKPLANATIRKEENNIIVDASTSEDEE